MLFVGVRTAEERKIFLPRGNSYKEMCPNDCGELLLGVLLKIGIRFRTMQITEIHRFDSFLQSLENAEESGYDEDLADHSDQHTSNGCSTQ